jgi:hypothetical protein
LHFLGQASSWREQTITKLLEQPKTNCFSLVKDPSQTIFDNWRTTPPVQAFQNGFSGWDAAQIQHYLANDLPQSALDPMTNITKEQFAILDKTSEEDETVTIYQLLWGSYEIRTLRMASYPLRTSERTEYLLEVH